MGGFGVLVRGVGLWVCHPARGPLPAAASGSPSISESACEMEGQGLFFSPCLSSPNRPCMCKSLPCLKRLVVFFVPFLDVEVQSPKWACGAHFPRPAYPPHTPTLKSQKHEMSGHARLFHLYFSTRKKDIAGGGGGMRYQLKSEVWMRYD